ncbi:hypothetical protein L3X38_017747 [Prunus dulcis]|uniref:DUF4216 domain-containing protein n=1 Tax=Prunus dulcis TaxID=3755 RepID=A0AAD4WAB6_PRUDU|nr:hypothetical protein L3X38_017747 [Prunus dulcis]
MDKSWMHQDRRSKAYELGVEAFLKFAVEILLTTTHIHYPCVKCDFGYDPYEFANVVEDGDQPLYPGCIALLWTINDFPAYENLSSCVVKGYKACPICGYDTTSHREHMIHIKTTYPKFRKRTKWLQDRHNSTFIQWLRFKVQSELNGEDNNGVSENLRWLAAGPSMEVPSYKSYLIKGIKFNTKAQDDVRAVQNSGVYLLAQTMQVANAKDKNLIVSNMGFYGVIQDIWDLEYQKFTIPFFRCDLIDNTFGLVVDQLGFTLVDLSKIGHRNDQFVMASQVKKVFFVDDPIHRGWSIVLSMPNREYNDVIGDNVSGDVRIECEPFTRGMPNVDTFDELAGEFGSQIFEMGVKIYRLNDTCNL